MSQKSVLLRVIEATRPTGKSVRVDAVRPRRDDEIVLLDGLDRRNVLHGDPALAVALGDAGARAARKEDPRRGRLVGEELEARRPPADGDHASDEAPGRDDDAVHADAVGRAAVEECRAERSRRLDRDEPRGHGPLRRCGVGAEELEEAGLVALGVAQLQELALEALDLGGERAVRREEAAPRRRPRLDVGRSGPERRHALDERGHGGEKPRLARGPPAGPPHLEREPDEAQREQHREQDLGSAGGE